MMNRPRHVAPVVLVAALLLAGCSQPAAEPEARTARAADERAAVAEEPGESADDEPAYTPRTASGTIVSDDGLTSATFEIETSSNFRTEDPDAELGDVRLTDIVSPFDSLAVGGALVGSEPGPCFDTGLRTGGGEIAVGSAPQSTIMPMDAEGIKVAELVLTITEGDPNAACFYRVIARAPLVWDED